MKRMNSDEIKEVQAILFKMLCTFKEICDDENLWYSLASGTMLGAIRENGFIPWDDDVDIYMLLPDRDRFRAAFQKRHPDGMVLMRSGVDQHYTKSHDKICYTLSQKYKIELDIYSLIGLPTDYRKRIRFIRTNHYLDMLFRCKYNKLKDSTPGHKPFLLLVRFVDLFIPDALINRIFASRESRYDLDKADYVSILSCGRKSKGYSRRIFGGTIDHVFNGVMFKIPSGWEEYLTQAYGDYMTPRKM